MAQQQFTEQEKRDLHYVFSLFDAGEVGRLEVEDVNRALRLLGFKTARATVEEIADSRATGQQPTAGVSFDSFLAIVARLQGSSYDAHEELLQVQYHSSATPTIALLLCRRSRSWTVEVMGFCPWRI